MFAYIVIPLAITLIYLVVRYANSLEHSKESPSADTNRPEIPVFEKLMIKYSDSNGLITQREIRTIAYDADAGHIRAKCMLRKSERTFRIDRIIEAIDMSTGEVITTRLRSHLRKNRQKP